MPELPEVETIKRQLLPFLKGKSLKHLECLYPPLIKSEEIPINKLLSRPLTFLKRHGKVLFMEFDELYLKLHLRLTGSLVIKRLPEKEKHLLAIFHFEGIKLFFYDVRRFSELKLLNKEGFFSEINSLGKDALSITLEEFKSLFSMARRAVKALFLDQQVISGLGNIYTDEILFRAGIHPLRPANSLEEGEVIKLYQVMKETLKRAIKLRGSSVRDYVDAYGEKGLFQKEHLVYGKRGKPCPECGTPLSYTKILQRGTTFCPECQK